LKKSSQSRGGKGKKGKGGGGSRNGLRLKLTAKADSIFSALRRKRRSKRPRRLIISFLL